MAWKPKTIAGKILKGAIIAGGSVLGLAVGTKIVTGVAGAAGGAIKTAVNAVRDARTARGTTVLAKNVNQITSAIRQKVDLVKESAVNLVAGTTGVQRDYIRTIKERTREEQQKMNAVEKAVLAGASPAEARAAVGLAPEELVSYDGEPIAKAGMFDFLQNKNVLYIIGAVALLFILTKGKR